MSFSNSGRLIKAVVFVALLLLGVSAPEHVSAQGFDPKSKSLKVDSDREGFILLDLPTTKMKLSPFVVFVRPNGSDFEIIARGKIETIQDDKILVSLDRQSIIKFPLKGDLAVPLGTPKDWPKDSDERIIDPPLSEEDASAIPDPGFVELQYGFLKGSLTTTPSDGTTNAYKIVKAYQPSYLRFTYYTDMFWHLGLQFEQWNDSVPTKTYYRNLGPSTDSVTNLSLNYRFSRLWWKNRVRPILRLVATSSKFSTINPDEAVLSTTMSGYGVGAQLQYEETILYKPRVGRFGYSFSHAFIGVDALPLVTVEDTGSTKRGNGGAFILDYKIAASGIAYFDFIPVLKRWTVEVGYGGRMTSLAFAGRTSKNPSDFYVIPEGTTSKENYGFFYVTLGLRFADALGQALKPR
ncbi:MAG: hypothetical protein EOP05_14820 [Proteobacteria bacterium]|nr:MAG: hypothetical protein EOP05_14820 [Pseudomonadota bacterium]